MPGQVTIGNTVYPFDEEIFALQFQNEPNLVRDAMVTSGAMVVDPYIENLIANGSNLYTIPFYGNLADGDEDNYDGQTNMSISESQGSYQRGVVFGRMKGWKAPQFVADFTSANPMAAISARIQPWYVHQTQKRIMGITDAVLGLAGMSAHVVSKNTVDENTLSDATQEIWGQDKDQCSLAIMHSAVAQKFEDLNRSNFLKYTDATGIERRVRTIDINGITCILDDGMPYTVVGGTSGVYTMTIGGTVASGDVITVNGVKTTLDGTSGASATAAATAVKAALDASALAQTYTMSRSSAVITFTEKEGKVGSGKPTATIVSSAGTAVVATTTQPSGGTRMYSTYLYGAGALLTAPAPVTKPVETWRDPVTNGGVDFIGTRRRETIHPNGFTFTAPDGMTDSPSNAQLFNTNNWSMAFSDHRAMPIGKLVCPGHTA